MRNVNLEENELTITAIFQQHKGRNNPNTERSFGSFGTGRK